jgi:hypothetical protein
MYPAFNSPLLADRQTASDWEAVLAYAQVVFEVVHPLCLSYYIREPRVSPDMLLLRGYLARAYSASANTTKAFDLYRPAFEDAPGFEIYSQVRRLVILNDPALGGNFMNP